ncbi:ABC transporter substrate-binding protein [bacterium]|nr:ABC transporter substrate-binding protein [bacterium]NIN91432.1 ABC transporter substrate-binding protein [bacterium]NIO17842.1 ABC transporter substrate-binding protein [bacterium]NIO72823.1 ABC transporter substrate-binding protein [bacterium]
MKHKIIFLIFSILLITSCSSQEPPLKSNSPFGVSSTDDIGREVAFDHPPQRIVSLDPSITEILFALGLNNEVVGVTDYCDYPQQAKSKLKVGGYIDPNIEAIALLEPDLVVTTLKTNTPRLIEQLEDFGIKVFVLDPKKIEDIFENISSLAKLTYREKEATELLGDLKERLRGVRKKVAGISRPGVFLEMGKDPLISVGRGSFAHDLIEIAGGRNVVAQSSSSYRRYTLEEILLADPEVIIICSMTPDDPCLAQKEWWKKWANMSAVRNGRIYVVEANLLTRPGPRMVDGLTEIAKAIHPEIFPGRER